MKRFAQKTALGLATIATIAAALATAPAIGDSRVEGRWWSGPKDVGYEFRLCGINDEQLCGWLTYAKDPSPNVQKYVGTQVMQPAQRVGKRKWKGSIYLAGYHLNGTLTLASRNRIQIDGCVAFIICGEYNVYREK